MILFYRWALYLLVFCWFLSYKKTFVVVAITGKNRKIKRKITFKLAKLPFSDKIENFNTIYFAYYLYMGKNYLDGKTKLITAFKFAIICTVSLFVDFWLIFQNMAWKMGLGRFKNFLLKIKNRYLNQTKTESKLRYFPVF